MRPTTSAEKGRPLREGSEERTMKSEPRIEPMGHERMSEDIRTRRTPTDSVLPMGSFGPMRPEKTRGKKNEANKALCPSTLQKFCKKFDGSGDLYDHIAQYRQLLFA